RANTSICGPGSSVSCVARFAFPKRRRCTIWSLVSSSIAMSLGSSSDMESTALKHFQKVYYFRPRHFRWYTGDSRYARPHWADIISAQRRVVSDCVEMHQNRQDENGAFFWHQICHGSRL